MTQNLVKCPRCNGSGDLCVGCSGVGSDPMDDMKGVYFGGCGNIVECPVCDGKKVVKAGTKCLDVLTRRMVVAA